MGRGAGYGVIGVDGSDPVAPLISCIARVGNVLPAEEPVTAF